MRFKYKLVAYFGGLLGLVLGASLWTANRVETRRAEEEVLAGLETTRQVFEETLASREKQLATSLKLLSGDFAFKQAVATGDPETVLSATQNHRARIGSDVLIVTDPDGKVLADSRGRGRKSLARLGVVRSALDGRPSTEVAVLDGVPYQLSAAAIVAPDVIGVLLSGFQIDDPLAQALKRSTRTEISFAADGKVFASTLEPPRRDALAAALGTLEPGLPRILPLGGERYLTAPSRRGAAVVVLLSRSWDQALAPARELRQLLMTIGLCGLGVTVLLGLLIASGVTASLSQLVAATRGVGEGRYDVSLDIRSRDEVAELGKAFTDMARGLVEREKIRSVLRKAVSKEIAEALLAKGQIDLGGEERTVTVLFSDIRSFTSIAEGLAPPRLVEQLNAYFSGMAQAIDAHHGVIDKFVGDAIMALFGAPLDSPVDPANAVRAALAMGAELEKLNAVRAKAGLEPWKAGIGINTGRVVAGTLGSEDRWSYTVIGDAVNLASRLEGLTKHYGVRVIVSDSTRKEAGPAFCCRALDQVVVKGRTEPVEIFEVLGEGPAPAWLADFEAGLAAARHKRWDEAKLRFEAVLVAAPEDAPTTLYLERVRARELEPASEEPEGPTRMTSK